MPYVRDFPPIFAVVRTQAIRGPCLQVLSSFERRRHYYITNNSNEHSFMDSYVERLTQYQMDRNIYTLPYSTEEFPDINEVKFWVLPLVLRYDNMSIPIVEFQYRSWIPGNYTPIPIQGAIYSDDILLIMERIQRERLEEIRSIEDIQSARNNRGGHYLNTMYGGPDDVDDRLTAPRGSLVGAVPQVRIVEVQSPPVERVVVKTEIRTKPIPKAVGDILLANARSGTDSCPIAALTFKECDKLSVSSCFHIFDQNSLARWMQTSTNCPVCRSKIENVISE